MVKLVKYTPTFALLVFVTFTTACSSIAIRTAIEINAPTEEVYAVLSDLDSYPKWNPYHRKVEGKFEEGAQLKIYVLRPDGKKAEVPPHMLRIVENEEITWGGGIRGIFHAYPDVAHTRLKMLLSYMNFIVYHLDINPINACIYSKLLPIQESLCALSG
ncbi:hypothetical protein Dvar_46320 [Desulfosarcina variabilis str. Montpellier]